MKRTNDQISVTASKDYNAIAKSIVDRGYAVVDVGKYNLPRIRNKIDEEIGNFREYRDEYDRAPLGGFAAYGNPSSFHNRTVRTLRMLAYKNIAPILDALKPDPSFKKEAIIDRLMVRPVGASPSAESWHRDEANNAQENDIVLGGWWNFDDCSSYLSCVEGSHKGVKGHDGFVRFSKEEGVQFSSRKIRVEVPKGHILLFNENLVHEVMARKLKYQSYRLFLGWRITNATEPLDAHLLVKLQTQAAIQIKSGQEPPMWAKLHWTNWVEKLDTFSLNFKNICRSDMTVKTGKNAGKTYNIVHRHMESLEHYGFEKYLPYKTSEIDILLPH